VLGILSYGLNLPFYRLPRKFIFEAMGWYNPGLAGLSGGQKAVANHDEDSLTLAVAAGIDALDRVERSQIEALYLASTTLPYAERSNAAIAAEALNLDPQTRTAELGGALKAGTTALIAALQEKDSGPKLVCASDCRLARAGGVQEPLTGDGAAAFVVGQGQVIAEFEESFSLSHDFADQRRLTSRSFLNSWEERWIRTEGYAQFLPQVINGLLDKAGLKAGQVAKVAFPPYQSRDHAGLAKKLGLDPGQVQEPLLASVGNTGAAHPLLMLAAALEEAQPGDRIVLASFGSGAEALLFRVTEAMAELNNRNKLKRDLNYKDELDSYSRYLSFKGLLPKEAGIRGEEIAPTSLSLTWRERNAVLRLTGGQCRACGTPQFPRERICINPACGAVDQMDDYTFADKTGRLFTYTADHLTYSEDPPQLYGIVDFDGGGRYWFDLTDCRLDSLKVGQPVQMTFRRKYQDQARSLYGYFWKARPLKD